LRSQSICLNGEHESQVFIIVQLKHKFTKKRVTIISVHLKAYEDFAPRRAKQIEFILKVLKEHVLETEQDAFNNQAVILCGDMNGDFLEPFYKLIVNDEVFKFRDAYPKFEKSNRRQKNAIDYVFYTDECLNLMNLLEVDVPSKKRHFELPSLEYPSDHFSLVCDFQIAK
jgi:nocturnin